MAGIFTLKHGTATLRSADGTAITKNLSPGVGNFTVGAIQAGCVEATPVYNRGTFQELVEGQQQAVDVSIELLQEGKISGSAGATVSPSDGVLKATDFASATTRDPGGVVHTADLVLVCSRGGVTSTVTVTNWRGSIAFSEDAGGNKLAFSGTAYATDPT